MLVVDDILTTGATCSEAARVLQQAGAAEVTVLVLARTPAGGDAADAANVRAPSPSADLPSAMDACTRSQRENRAAAGPVSPGARARPGASCCRRC